MIDEVFMAEALREAEAALLHEDVPIGCVIVRDGEIVGRGHNARERDKDPTAHAEILALREAAAGIGSWRVEGATLYVTLEPCFMCAGAMVLGRVARLVYGAPDPKAGAAGSLADVPRDPRLNHRLTVESGVLQEDCSALLKRFFVQRR